VRERERARDDALRTGRALPEGEQPLHGLFAEQARLLLLAEQAQHLGQHGADGRRGTELLGGLLCGAARGVELALAREFAGGTLADDATVVVVDTAALAGSV